MTLEIMRQKSQTVYRINPENPRIIDRKRNVARARWEWHSYYLTDDQARTALFQLERGNDITEGNE